MRGFDQLGPLHILKCREPRTSDWDSPDAHLFRIYGEYTVSLDHTDNLLLFVPPVPLILSELIYALSIKAAVYFCNDFKRPSHLESGG